MNKDHVIAKFEDGKYIGFEITGKGKSSSGGETPVKGVKDIMKEVSADDILENIGEFVTALSTQFKKSDASKAELSFGIKFDVTSGTGLSLIISSTTEATMEVKMCWEKKNESEQ